MQNCIIILIGVIGEGLKVEPDITMVTNDYYLEADRILTASKFI